MNMYFFPCGFPGLCFGHRGSGSGAWTSVVAVLNGPPFADIPGGVLGSSLLRVTLVQHLQLALRRCEHGVFPTLANLSASLSSKWTSYSKHLLGCCFYPSDSLCLLTVGFRWLAFYVIIDMIWFKSTILLFFLFTVFPLFLPFYDSIYLLSWLVQ